MSDDVELQQVRLIAEMALAKATTAVDTAGEARASARDGYRSCYQAWGEVLDQLRQLVAAVAEIQARLGRLVLDSVHPPPPDDWNGDT